VVIRIPTFSLSETVYVDLAISESLRQISFPLSNSNSLDQPFPDFISPPIASSGALAISAPRNYSDKFPCLNEFFGSFELSMSDWAENLTLGLLMPTPKSAASSALRFSKKGASSSVPCRSPQIHHSATMAPSGQRGCTGQFCQSWGLRKAAAFPQLAFLSSHSVWISTICSGSHRSPTVSRSPEKAGTFWLT
jgi:hypothetical protein